MDILDQNSRWLWVACIRSRSTVKSGVDVCMKHLRVDCPLSELNATLDYYFRIAALLLSSE